MPVWYYLSRPSNLACHDLTTYIKPPANLKSLLGLGLKFCPIPKQTISNYSSTHKRFLRNIYIKDIFAGNDPNPNFNPRLYIRSKWEPQPNQVSSITKLRTQRFLSSTVPLFKRRRGRQNLLPHQQHLLRFMQQQNDLMIITCDKNLGPAVIERQAYIRLVYHDHLNDTNTYKFLTSAAAYAFIDRIAYLLRKFIKKHRQTLGKTASLFLTCSLNVEHTEKDYHQQLDPSVFAQFYALAKVHKQPLKT